MPEIAYKAVNVVKGRYYSFLSNPMTPYFDLPNHNGAIIEYFANVPVRPDPECGPLCTFLTAEIAYAFASEWGNKDFEIWESIIRKSTEIKIWCRGTETSLGRCPAGTVLADSVELKTRCFIG